jgi:hypothetical protein
VAIVARMWSWTSVGERVPSKRRSSPFSSYSVFSGAVCSW